MKWFKIGIICLFSLFISAVFFIETSFGKRFIQKVLVQSLQKSGINIQIGQISGNFPQEIDATDVVLPGLIHIQKLHIELSLLSLLGGELRIEELKAENVQILDDRTEGQTARTEQRRLPLAVQIRHYHLTDVQWRDYPVMAVVGSASMRRHGTSAYIEGKLTRNDLPEALLEFELARNRFGKVEGDFELSSPTLAALTPWIEPEDIDGQIHVHVHTRGTLSAFSGSIDGKFNGTKGDDLLRRQWAFKSRIAKKCNEPIQLQKVIASSKGLRIGGFAELTTSGALNKATFHTRIDLATLDLPEKWQGTIFANGALEKTSSGITTHALWKSDQVSFNDVSVQTAAGSIKGTYEAGSFSGALDAKASYIQMPWTLNTDFVYRSKPEKSLTLQQLHVESQALEAEGSLTLVNRLWIGNLTFLHANASLFQTDLSGTVQGTLTLASLDGQQQIQTDMTVRNLTYGPVSVAITHFTTDGGTLSAQLERIKWKKLVIDTADLELLGDQFALQLDGKLLNLHSGGQWALGDPLIIQTLEGRLLQHGVQLLEPSKMEWGPDHFSWERLYVGFGQGTIDGSWQQEGMKTSAKATLQQIPLDVLSLNFMESKAEGTFDLVATLQKNGRKTDADWTWTLGQGLLANPNDQMMWWVENPPEPLIIAGIMKGGLHQDELQLKTDIHVRHLPFFSFDLTTPVHLDRDWEFSSPPGRSFGFVKANGQLEDLFDFLDLGMHRVSGKINCDLQISHAQAKGTCTLQNGAYENYITGTELINISAALEGSGDNLILKHLTASDLNLSEVLTAKGMIHLSLQDLFPFHFDVKFDHLNVVQIDLVTASAEGHVSIDGNLASTLAAGAVQITRGDIAIPRHISRSYPDLQVIYKHRPITPVIATSSKPPYPLGLDLTVKAPKAIFINGRGLNSEWSGEFAVGGTYAEPAVTGSLELIEGEFSFAGRRFKLNQGSLTMQGNQYKLPLIDLTATTTEQAISITARLKGPINRPQLTFQSLPPLPLSSILSYLLFGKSLSDVTGLQALQLAGTVASVAGEGPDILEMTRKSLGVDRLQIVMTPTKSGEGYEGKETISLQVGKVITPGVIVTIKQSAEDSNPDIGVEVDLTHGFVLEVESQQQPEQGKFSLKWNVNY